MVLPCAFSSPARPVTSAPPWSPSCGRPGTEDDTQGGPLAETENAAAALAQRGIRASVIRLAPVVHSVLDTRGFTPALIALARLHGVADEGVPFREFAAAIGRNFGVPTASVAPGEAAGHFGFPAMFAGADNPASSALTRQRLGWTPTQPGLLADLDAGHYFA